MTIDNTLGRRDRSIEQEAPSLRPQPKARPRRQHIGLGRYPVLMLSVIVIAITLATTMAASPADAHTTGGNATPANDGPHPWETNGCSTPIVRVNAVAGIYDFGHACKHHDGCYTGFPRDGRPTWWTSRSQCDSWFLYDMQASCRWQHGADPLRTWAGRQCMQWASNYLLAVRTYGAGGYHGPIND